MINNPILRKELLLRTRFRQGAPVKIGGALTILGVLGFFYYQIITTLWAAPSPSSAHGTWTVVMVLQYAAVCLLAPAISANAIAQEKEQQTWEMLISTRLRPDEIVLGKLFARLIMIVALMVLVLPVSLYAMAHTKTLTASASPETAISVTAMVRVEATTFITGLFFATFSLFMSWLLKRTLYALMLSFTFVVGGLILCTSLIAAMLQNIVNDSNMFASCPLMWFNPIMMFINALGTNDYAQAPLYLNFGLTGYVLMSVLLVWRMIAGFRRFSND